MKTIGNNIMPYLDSRHHNKSVVHSLNKGSISFTKLFQTKPRGEKRSLDTGMLEIQDCTYTKK